MSVHISKSPKDKLFSQVTARSTNISITGRNFQLTGPSNPRNDDKVKEVDKSAVRCGKSVCGD